MLELGFIYSLPIIYKDNVFAIFFYRCKQWSGSVDEKVFWLLFSKKVTELADGFRDSKIEFYRANSLTLYYFNLNKVGSAANLSAKY